MVTDLFGRPIYDTPPARQLPLFSARQWFGEGYWDAERFPEPCCNVAAYVYGHQAGRRELPAGTYGTDGEARAYRAAVAAGNVTE